MKKKALVLILVTLMLVGCTNTQNASDNKNESKNNITENKTDLKIDAGKLFIGYDAPSGQNVWAYENNSYIVNGKGEKIIELSDNYKNIIEIDGKEYAVEREIGNVTLMEENGYEYYNTTYNYCMYDSDGTLVGGIDDASYCEHIADGNFIVYKYGGGNVDIANIFTGEREAVDDVECLWNDDKVVGLLFFDSDGLVGMSKPDRTDFVSLEEYDYGYEYSSKGRETFLCCVKRESMDTNKTDILRLDGTKVLEKSFENVNSNSINSGYLFAYDGETTTVINCDDGSVLREIEGNVLALYFDGSYITCGEVENENDRHTQYTVFDKDGNVISAGWDGYMYSSNDAVEVPYYFMEEKHNAEDGYGYTWVTYVIDKNGERIMGPFGEKNEWISSIFDNFFVISKYNEELDADTFAIYDFEGNEIKLEKDYISLDRIYIYGDHNDVLYAKYENPVSNGYLYDIYDRNLEMVYEGANYVSTYTQGRNVISVSKGFDLGIVDSESGQWIYKERKFAGLED